MQALPTTAAMFAVPTDVLWPAVDQALAGRPEVDGAFTAPAYALAMFTAAYKPLFYGRRWEHVGWTDAFDDEDLEDDNPWNNPTLVAPVERLAFALRYELRFVASYPKWAGGLVMALGADATTSRAFFWPDPLTLRLDPPRYPSPEQDFPSELSVLDASRAEEFREMVVLASQTYAQADGDLAAEIAALAGLAPGAEADSLIFTMLSGMLNVTELLAQDGTEILVGVVM